MKEDAECVTYSVTPPIWVLESVINSQISSSIVYFACGWPREHSTYLARPLGLGFGLGLGLGLGLVPVMFSQAWFIDVGENVDEGCGRVTEDT